MSEYKIRVIIEDRHGRAIAEACAPMDRFFQETIQPIKLSDGPIPFFDTPPDVVLRVKASRKATAEMLTPKIAKVLMDAMDKNDRFNGYSKDELRSPQ